MRNYKNYTDEEVIRYTAEVRSMSQLLKKLGLRQAGGNFVHMKRTLQKLGVNCDHWTGLAWSKDQQLKDWSQYVRSGTLRRNLLKVKGHQCESCENRIWQGQPIPLEVHHKDGNRTNNVLENLQLLCCNCHAQTDNWRARNIK